MGTKKGIGEWATVASFEQLGADSGPLEAHKGLTVGHYGCWAVLVGEGRSSSEDGQAVSDGPARRWTFKPK
jgi:hypothetical protein